MGFLFALLMRQVSVILNSNGAKEGGGGGKLASARIIINSTTTMDRQIASNYSRMNKHASGARD
jgi:hypothetical protein